MMQKRLPALFAALVLLLCACGGQPRQAQYEVERQGRTYTVDTENRRILYEGVAYLYEQHVSGSRASLVILYPDGSTWQEEKDGVLTSRGWSEDYDPAPGVSGDALAEVLAAVPAAKARKPVEPAFLLLTLLGVFQALCPRMAWALSKERRYRTAAPSDTALFFGRIVGVCAAIAGVVLCFS